MMAKTILYVEDNEVNRRLVRDLPKNASYRLFEIGAVSPHGLVADGGHGGVRGGSFLLRSRRVGTLLQERRRPGGQDVS